MRCKIESGTLDYFPDRSVLPFKLKFKFISNYCACYGFNFIRHLRH